MSIIDYALQMEKDGEEYYRELAAKASDTGVKKVFEFLADAEAEHYETFLQMKENQPVTRSDDKHISKIKNLFSEMKEGGVQGTVDQDTLDAYIKARDVEKVSQETYEQKAEEISDPEQKEMCLMIAGEEAKHYLILDNLIEFLQHPTTWVEDAEWRHMDDY
jgi:rubrerythrin